MTAPKPKPDVFGANAVDRDQLLAKLRLVQHQGCAGWLRHWWRVEDERTGIAVASGRALTEWGARRRKHRAYLTALNPERSGRLKRAVETSPLLNRYRSWVN